MDSIWRTPIIRNVVIALLLLPAIGMAADFELFWDANCNSDPALEGYYINYREEGSVIAAPNEATAIYIALTDGGFDPSDPSYLFSGLTDDMLYCFAVSASYENEDSRMSNEVCGINGQYAQSQVNAENSSGGCFVGALK